MCLAIRPVRRFEPALFLVLLLLFPVPATLAQEPFSASRTVIVVDGATEVFAGNESIDQIRPGSIVRYSRENGPWLLIPRYAGWVNSEQVLPIEAAVDHFDTLIRKSPTAQAFQHRGIVHCHLGEYAAALADFKRAADMGLEDAGLWINRGVAHQRAGYVRAAIDDYTQAIRLDATNAQAYDNRSSALAELSEWEESLADSNEAIRLDPKYAEAFNNRGVTYRLQGDYARAIEDYDAAIERFRGYSAAFANRGYARKQLGQYEPAVADYEEAIRLDPESAQAHNDLAWLLATCADRTLRDATLATEHAQQACELTGMVNGDFLDTLAAAHAAAGEFNQAVDFGEQALKLIDDEQKPAVQQRLELYRQQTPFVEK
jgi:tetratricopeptide (TPR) repeat protein